VTPLDVERERERARTSMEFERGASREDYLPNSVGNAAWLALGEAISGWIVGLDEDEVRPVAERSREWLEDSVRRGEEFGITPSYFGVIRMEALAVATWIAGDPPEPRFRDAVELWGQAFADIPPRSDEQLLKEYMPDYVRDCCAAGELQAGAEMYERHGGRPLEDEEDVRTPLELAVWICKRGGADPPFQAQTAARVLREPLLDWLGSGQGVRAGAWLYLVFDKYGPHASAAEAFRTAHKFVVKAATS
jgi:hypothetical protein